MRGPSTRNGAARRNDSLTAAAAEVIRRIADELPELLVGAGTVLTVPQAEQAVGAGARCSVAPGFDPVRVDWCRAHKVPVLPGAATLTEGSMALARRLRLLRVFPAAEAGGHVHAQGALRAISRYVDRETRVANGTAPLLTPGSAPAPTDQGRRSSSRRAAPGPT